MSGSDDDADAPPAWAAALTGAISTLSERVATLETSNGGGHNGAAARKPASDAGSGHGGDGNFGDASEKEYGSAIDHTRVFAFLDGSSHHRPRFAARRFEPRTEPEFLKYADHNTFSKATAYGKPHHFVANAVSTYATAAGHIGDVATLLSVYAEHDDESGPRPFDLEDIINYTAALGQFFNYHNDISILVAGQHGAEVAATALNRTVEFHQTRTGGTIFDNPELAQITKNVRKEAQAQSKRLDKAGKSGFGQGRGGRGARGRGTPEGKAGKGKGGESGGGGGGARGARGGAPAGGAAAAAAVAAGL